MSDTAHVTDDGFAASADPGEVGTPVVGDGDGTDDGTDGSGASGTGEVQPIADGYFITTADGAMTATDTDGDHIIDTVRGTTQDGSSAEFAFQLSRHGERFTITTADGEITYTSEQAQRLFPDAFELLDGLPTPDPSELDGGQAGSPAIDDPTNGDNSEQTADFPPVSDDGQIVGNPSEYASDWFDQGWDGACAPSAIAVIASAYTGEHYGLDEMVQEVNGLGLWQVGSDGAPGLTIESVATVLDDLGIPATATTGDLGTLEQHIAAGDSVVVAVNGEQLWQQAGDTSSADHAVVVSAIDERNGIVYLSDSGIAGGNMEQVPLDVFLSSWDTSGDAMVTCDQSVDEWRAEQAAESDATPSDGSAEPPQAGLPAVADDGSTDGSVEPPQQGLPAVADDASAGALDADVEGLSGEQGAPNRYGELGGFVAQSGWVLLPVLLDLGIAAAGADGSGR